MMERLDFDAGAPHDASELGIHVARYGLVRGLCRERRVLDIACGAGFGSYLMVERWGAASVDAVDVSAEAIASARALFDRPEITWRHMDADALDPGQLAGPYDLIVSLETIEHLENPETFLRALEALRGPEGVIVLSCPNDHWYYGSGRSKNAWHKHTYTFDEFKALAEGILGPAHSYFLGATVGGFSNVRLSSHGPQATTLLEALRRTENAGAVVVPGTPSTEPTIDRSLYYAGVWGPVGPEESAVIVPMSPEHRLGVEHLRPHFVREDRPKPRVVLVADIPGWAYDNIAQQIRSALGDMFDIDVVYAAEYEDWIACIHDVVYVRHADLAHFFWREYLFAILAGDPTRRVCERYGMSEQSFQTMFTMLTLTTSVYDHLYLDDESIRQRAPLLGCVDGYSVSSEKLYDTYRERYATPPNVVIEDGVDLTAFRPAAGGRPPSAEREVIVGWAGNSDWNRTDTWDPKGLHTVLKPALERLRAAGVRVRCHFIDSSEERRPRSEMPAFDREIDIYVCVSEIEGTPNPVLEAMACGVPVVSTDVGIVRQVFGAEQHRFILPDRSVDSVVAHLRTLIDDAALRRRLSDENLARIRHWSWAHLMPRWLQLFKAASLHKRATLRVTVAQTELMRQELRRRDDVLATTQKLAEERQRRMQELEAAVAERDAAAGEQARRVAHLEWELARERTLRGMLGRVAHWLRPAVVPFVILLWPLALLLLSGDGTPMNAGYPYPLGSRGLVSSQGAQRMLPGYLPYDVLQEPLAGHALYLSVQTVGALGLFLIVRELFGGRGAVLSTLWLVSYIGFRMVVGSHWSDGAAVACYLAAAYCITRVARRRSWRGAAFLGGAGAAAMVAAQPLTVVLLPALLYHFAALNRRFEAHRWGPVAALFGAGALGLAIPAAIASALLDVPLVGAHDPALSGVDPPTGAAVGALAVLPLAVVAGSIVCIARGWITPAVQEAGRRWREVVEGSLSRMLAAQYVYVAVAFLVLRSLAGPVLARACEASLLIPGMALVIGAFFARILVDLPRMQYAVSVGGAAVLFAAPWIAPLAPWLHSIAGSGGEPALLVGAVILFGCAVLWLLHMNLLSVLTLCLCVSIANLALVTELQSGQSGDAGRADRLSAAVRPPG